MAIKEIVWSKLAEAEFAGVLEFYFKRNGNAKYSLKILDEVEDLISKLIEHENLGRLTNNRCTRVIPIKHFEIFYEINHERIEIVSFWDSRQNSNKRKVI